MLAGVPLVDNPKVFWVKAMSHEPRVGGPVLATPTGKRLGPVKKSRSELLGAANRVADRPPRGAWRITCSLRHFHISQQLVAGVDVLLLAENADRSGAMTERFYGQ